MKRLTKKVYEYQSKSICVYCPVIECKYQCGKQENNETRDGEQFPKLIKKIRKVMKKQ